jgi:MFS family permease
MTHQAPEDPDPAPAGDGARRAARASAGGVRAVARGTARAGRATFRVARRASHAEGAGDSGLSRLIELHAFNAAGDAAVAISLAGTLFFQVPTGEARVQVALFLGMTMLPFAIVAPLIGPFLDRFSHGRRWAIGATMALRAFLCWVLADAVINESTVLFPAALGVLVASKAYGVTKAAAAPRLVPDGITLVKANARISLAGVIGVAVSAPLAALAASFGSEWSLRYAFLVFVAATILAILLPKRVDSSQGEAPLELNVGPSSNLGSGKPRKPGLRIPGPVAFALRANCGPRFLSGFLTMFMAFLLRENPIAGWEDRPELLLGVVIGAAGKDSPRERALAHVFGFTIVNDLTARDLQRRHGQWFKGKGLDASCPMGPWIVVKGALPGFADLAITLRVNGETRQRSRTARMVHDIPTIIEHLSRGMTLEPGDVIATGTPEGVGYAMDPPRFLGPGDVIEAEIEGIGVLRNRIV